MAGQSEREDPDEPEGENARRDILQRAALALILFALVFCALVGLYMIGQIRVP